MFENFTDCARKAMALANQEAQRFNHEYIGTEHILLGVFKEGSDIGAVALKNFGFDIKKIRLEIEKLTKTGPDMVTMGRLPQTPRAKKVIELCIEKTRDWPRLEEIKKQKYINTGFMLLGLLGVSEGTGYQVILGLGVKPNELREKVGKLIDERIEEATKPQARKQYEESEPLKMLIDPGQATAEDIGELFFKLSRLYRMMGGSGLEFRTLDVREGAMSNV